MATQFGLAEEDGYRLWLRYEALGDRAKPYAAILRQLRVEGNSATAGAVRKELTSGLSGLLGRSINQGSGSPADGAIVVGTPRTSETIRSLELDRQLADLGTEGFVIQSVSIGGRAATVIASNEEIGGLYGAFCLLRLVQNGQSLERLTISQKPKLMLRLLNHWDNLDGSIERGYAGRTLWQWDELPGKLGPRYTDYARANASIGINASVLNNVNANAKFLSTDYLHKAAALADLWRPYGIRVFLSANFALPKLLGGMTTCDPLDPSVAKWWKTKADEIYQIIPDFGGLLVKANSEGQPGPQDYQRTHADGANVLADALAPHGGTVIWRAFVYNESVDPDRLKRAYLEFTALEGKFRPNVAVQTKNGALDFMPREPFHPLFGATPKTPMLAEVQPAQEYLGHSKHLVYLGPMWKEFLDSDTYAKGPGSTVGKAIDGSVYPYRVTGMAGVSNTGTDPNWCGHHFSQANWYALGRLAWDHELPAEHIADEWVRMTFTNDPQTVETIRGMMMSSWETFISYSMPLGLHHLIGGDHYAPMPWNDREPRIDWTAVYYHRAARDGIGIDRSMKGNQAVGQYFPPARDLFDSLKTCPEKFLCWFHRVAWDYKMRSGKTFWQELCEKYYEGHEQAVALQKTWASLQGKIDARRHREVAERLVIQVDDSGTWRDRCLEYFQKFSGMPIQGT